MRAHSRSYDARERIVLLITIIFVVVILPSSCHGAPCLVVFVIFHCGFVMVADDEDDGMCFE